MSITKVDFETAKKLIDENKDLLILDVRDEDEYITGHAIGAILFTLSEIDESIAKETIPSYDTPLIVYCRSGKRSAQAADKLSALGYTRIYDVGGLIGWPYGVE